MKNNIVFVISAAVIPDSLKSTLETKLLVKFGSDITFEYIIDTHILAGIKIKFHDIEYHYDLFNQIKHIETEILN
jgi:F0F1-type ATP synthase delta subunit